MRGQAVAHEVNAPSVSTLPTSTVAPRAFAVPGERDGYICGLDGLRALAIAAVVLAHNFAEFGSLAEHGRAGRTFIVALERLGTAGVRLFFAISGYLICSRLLRELAGSSPGATLRSFYIRRASRILPPLVPYLATLAVAAALGVLTLRRGEIAAAALFAANYFREKSWYTTHFWSLAVEEHFYLVWAPILAWAGRRWAVVFAVAVIVVTAVVRPVMVAGVVDVHSVLQQTHLQLDAFMFPCLIALALRDPARRAGASRLVTLPTVITVAVALAVLSAPVSRGAIPGLDARTGQAALFAVFVVVLTLNPEFSLTRALEARWLTWLGRRSYGIYIWQQLIFVPSSTPLSTKALLLAPRVALVLGIAELSLRLVEMPLIKRGRRIARTVGPVASLPADPNHP